MNEVYYQCPVCGREDDGPGECRHGLARVTMQKRHVISNPINNIPFYSTGLFGKECLEIFARNGISIGHYKAPNQAMKLDEE